MPDQQPDSPSTARARRSPVAVVIPFAGGEQEAKTLVAALAPLRLGHEDELIAVDNSTIPVLAAVAGSELRVLEAAAEHSSYYARNVGAEASSADWLLFVDADCVPSSTLLDDYFSEPAADEVGALAGQVVAADQPGLLPRWAASRRLIDQELMGSGPGLRGAATANLLVRRAAWESVGGFHEGVRSGADIEFCWRLQDRGWTIEGRPDAVVRHLHRTTLREVAGQFARYGAGNAWQERRRPGSVPRLPLLPGIAVSVGGALFYALTLRFERALMKLVDGVAVAASARGRWRSNAAERGSPADDGRRSTGVGANSVVISSDYFAALSETFVSADVASLQEAGWRLRVEAVARPDRPRLGGTRGLIVNYLEDEGRAQRLRDSGWLAIRHPLGCLLDLRRRRRFAPEERLPLRALAPFARRLIAGGERRVHVHFALMAAASAIRVGAIAGVPVSVAAHAHEIYARPLNLREKLESASFAVADCDYTVTHLRELVGVADRDRIHKLVLGVDLERWRRQAPPGSGEGVVAVGRLVEKKGFGTLIEAVAILAQSGDKPRVRIVGDGPLYDELNARIRRVGVEELVELVGSLEPDEVRELVQSSELLCMPCVIAADGDRDSMPVVVKEALALEVPVVASDEVGLPEIVEPGWGKLAAPGDPQGLAEALGELRALSREQRAEMGRRGRAAVAERANLATESKKLARLLESDGNAG